MTRTAHTWGGALPVSGNNPALGCVPSEVRGFFVPPEARDQAGGSASLIGAGVGLAYGTAFLLPMLIQVATRSLRRTEAIDRCLISYGMWGALVLFTAIAVAYEYCDTTSDPMDWVLTLTLGSIGVHASLFAVGILRWARRRVWLGRVEQGKVPGWLVCEQQRFQGAQLEGLEVFCKPLLDRTGGNSFRVLARGAATATSEAYRTLPIAPKYLIV